MAGVLVAIDVALYGGVYRDATQPPDNLRGVGNLALADNQVLGKEVYVVINVLQCLVGDGHRRCRRRFDLAFLYKVYSGILNHLGVDLEAWDVRVLAHCRQYGVACRANAALYGQKLWRYVPGLHVGDEKLCYVVAHLEGRRCQRLERPSLLGYLAFHHTDDFLCVNGYIAVPDFIQYVDDGYGLSAKAALSWLVGVVKHPRARAVEVVELYDDTLCQSCRLPR